MVISRLVVVVVLLAGCTSKSDKATTSSPANLPAIPPGAEYTPPDGRFTIVIPGTPSIEDQPADPAIGKTEGRFYLVDLGQRSFLVSYTRFSAQRTDPKSELNNAQKSLLQTLNGKLKSEKDLQQDGYPAREVIVADSEGDVIRSRIIVTDFDLYQLIAVVRPGEESSPEVEKMFSSFHLLNPMPGKVTKKELRPMSTSK